MIIILGSTGLLGNTLIKEWSSSDLLYKGLSRKFDGIDVIKEFDNLCLLLDDLKPSVIINCIAERRPDIVDKNLEYSYSINTQFPINLTEYCKSNNVKLIHISSDYVFDGNNSPYEIESCTEPMNLYGKQKLLAEQAVKTYYNSVILRIPVIFSKYQSSLNESSLTQNVKKIMDLSINHTYDNCSKRFPVSTVAVSEILKNICVNDLRGIYQFDGDICYTKYEIGKITQEYLNLNNSKLISNNNRDTSRPYCTRFINNISCKQDKFIINDIFLDVEPLPKFNTNKYFLLMDLDGTLIDTEFIHFEAYKEAGIVETFDDYINLCHGITDTNVNKDKKKIKQDLYTKKIQEKELNFIPGAENLIIQLDKLDVNSCVVTNSSRKSVNIIRNKLPLLNKIKNWICREDYNLSKPSPECFELGLKYKNTNETVFGLENSLRGIKSLSNCTKNIIFIGNSEYKYKKSVLEHDCYYMDDLTYLENNIKNE
tara:strand:- start:1034 stop:2482 length:1449 start_codon:yes stop_codon:yes gene_type:complete